VRQIGDELLVTLPPLYRGLRLSLRDAVDRNEFGSHRVRAQNVSPIEPVLPLARVIVETSKRELPVVCEGEYSKRARTATHSRVEGYQP